MSGRPFLASAIFFSLAVALLTLACAPGVSDYEPFTTNGAIIYHEACARCHDDGFDAPLLLHGDVRNLTAQKIEDSLAVGRSGMPSFPLIDGEYRQGLVQFILERQAPADL
jgi:mono/diheme cytochrome c family protein